MSWKDRAVPAQSGSEVQQPSTGSSWRDRAVPAQQEPRSENYWSDTAKSAGNEIMSLPAVPQTMFKVATGTPLQQTPLFEQAQRAYKTVRGTMPDGVANTAEQMILEGKPFLQTPLGETAQGVAGYAKDLGNQAVSIAKTAGKALSFTPQMMMGSKPSDTMFGKQFRERPLGTLADLSIVAAPVAKKLFSSTSKLADVGAPVADGGSGTEISKEVETTPEPSIPNRLEMKGGQSINTTLGLRPNTIKNLTPFGGNPGIYGNKLLQSLADEGLVGKTYTESASKLLKDTKQAGKAVGDANKAIRDANARYAAGTSYYDQLKTDQSAALKPLLDESNKLLQNSPYTGERMVGKYMKRAYDHLATAANANGGELTLDAIKEEMTRLGDEYTPTNENVIDKVYGRLAELNDQMVKTVANSAKDPSLRDNLLKANARYSRNMRILPDSLKSSAGEPVGAMRLGTMYDNLKEMLLHGPTAGKTMIKAGRMLKGPGTPTESIFRGESK